MAVIVTACSNRKGVQPARKLRGGSLPAGELGHVAAAWASRLRDARPCIAAGDLYQGRNFSEARAAASTLGGDLYIVSAGLGVVRHDAEVIPYSITVADRSPDNVLARINAGPATAPGWWAAISARSPVGTSLAAVIRQRAPQLVLLALPSSYLSMLADDLESVHGRSLKRLRIFSAAPPAALSGRLKPFVMPYDERLDGPDSPLQGTRADFAARALRHFAESVLAQDPRGSVDGHKQTVSRLLEGWRPQAVPSRSRHSDEDLIGLIRRHWHMAGGLSTRMLRVLRDDLGVACEQGRFIRLFAAARAAVEAPS